MKKLLSSLAVVTLIGTASTNIIACEGGEKPTPPTPDTRNDIENKITSPIALGQLSENTKQDFLAKLQTALAKIRDLTAITINDYDVYKAGTTTAIQDSDITSGTSLNIKIVAKGNKFKGNKDEIKVNYTKHTPVPPIQPEFQKVSGWTDSNGTILSLANVNGTVYAGTYNAAGKSKLFKSNSTGTFESVSGWTDSNGTILSLANVNGTVYAGTKTANDKGKLFKSNSAGSFELVSGWTDSNGAIWSLANVNGTVYAGTKTAASKGNLYKSQS